MKSIFLALLLASGFALYAQDRQLLEDQAQLYYKHLASGNFDSLVNYAHPHNFNQYTREKFIEVISEEFRSQPKYKLNIVHIPPNFKFGEVKELRGRYYCIFYHDYAMSIKFTEAVPTFERAIILRIFERKYGSENMIYSSRRNTLIIKHRNKDLAVADEVTNYKWKFFNTIIDSKLREELGL